MAKKTAFILLIYFLASCGPFFEIPLNDECYDFIIGKWKVFKIQQPFGSLERKDDYKVFQFTETYIIVENRKLDYYFEYDCDKIILLFEDKEISFKFHKHSQDIIMLVKKVLTHESQIIGLYRVYKE